MINCLLDKSLIVLRLSEAVATIEEMTYSNWQDLVIAVNKKDLCGMEEVFSKHHEDLSPRRMRDVMHLIEKLVL